MEFSGQVYPNDTVGYFRIATVSGRQPIEPIALGQFLIGSGPSCQLRLGSSGIPEVHTMLAVEQDCIQLSAKAAEPVVYVNGSEVRECELQDGDLVEIADHKMLFRRVGAEERITLDETTFGSVADKTAEELVDKLEEQIHLVEELAQSPDRNLLQLLQAVASSTTGSNESVAESQPPEVSDELQQVKSLLETQHEASRIRLESLTEVLDNVVRQQKLIADTLEVLSNRIQALDSHPNYGNRKSA